MKIAVVLRDEIGRRKRRRIIPLVDDDRVRQGAPCRFIHGRLVRKGIGLVAVYPRGIRSPKFEEFLHAPPGLQLQPHNQHESPLRRLLALPQPLNAEGNSCASHRTAGNSQSCALRRFQIQ